jgi:hemolysin-activating ACP:hemolysin acyltransferase
MPTFGILPNDWRSGSEPWVVDLVAPNADGDRMLFRITRDLKDTSWEQVKYFRGKFKQVPEVRIRKDQPRSVAAG